MRRTAPGGCGAHLTRYAMYRRLRALVEEAGWQPGRVLTIGSSVDLCRRIGMAWSELAEANYPEETILALRHPDASFDAVVSDQVLEHVKGDPFAATDESLRVLRPGGLLLHTTCLVNPVHLRPQDYWRFTPDALELLVAGGADVIEADGWGNRMAVLVVGLGLRTIPVPESTWHPIHRMATRNDPDWPIVTWVLARKRGSSPQA